MKKTSLLFILLFLSLLLIELISAQAGCCSRHGGVCGCKCCDGTSLSATCAPNYPSCSDSPTTTASIAGAVASTQTCDSFDYATTYCNLSAVYRNVKFSNCTIGTKLVENCPNGCSDISTNDLYYPTSNGVCNPITNICPEENKSGFYCKEKNVFQDWQLKDCNKTSKLIETCSYGCLFGECNSEPCEVINITFCQGTKLYLEQQSVDCNNLSTFIKECPAGCENGVCIKNIPETSPRSFFFMGLIFSGVAIAVYSFKIKNKAKRSKIIRGIWWIVTVFCGLMGTIGILSAFKII